jgi:hypothetical protein
VNISGVNKEYVLGTIQNDDDPIRFTADNATSGQYSDQVVVEAQLSQADAAGKTVTFALGSASTTAVSDSTGLARATLALKQAPGAYDLTAFSGADSTSVPFTIQQEDSVLSVALKALSNGKTRITGKLTDADSRAGIARRKLAFAVNGRSVGTATTSSGGAASLVVKVRKGSTVSLTFAGDSFYLGSEASKKR